MFFPKKDFNKIPLSQHQRFAFHGASSPEQAVEQLFIDGYSYFEGFVRRTRLDEEKCAIVLNLAVNGIPQFTKSIIDKILTFYQEVSMAKDGFISFGRIDATKALAKIDVNRMSSVANRIARNLFIAPADIVVVLPLNPKTTILFVAISSTDSVEHEDGVIKCVKYTHNNVSYELTDEFFVINGAKIKNEMGICPAFFCSANIEYGMPSSPIGGLLTLFDLLLFRHLSASYAQTLIMYPVVQYLKENCTASEEVNGVSHFCEKGIINGKKCKSCNNASKFGPGAIAGIGADSQEVNDYFSNDLIKFVSPSVASNEYIDKHNVELTDFILRMAMGTDSDANESAKNEMQVKMSFQTRESMLSNAATHVEKVLSDVLRCILFYEFGSIEQDANVFLGREYFLSSPEKLIDNYSKTVDFAPQYLIEAEQVKLAKTIGKNKLKVEKRLLWLAKLEPYSTLTWAQLEKLPTDPFLIFVKLNFTNLIEDFEVLKKAKIEDMDSEIINEFYKFSKNSYDDRIKNS